MGFSVGGGGFSLGGPARGATGASDDLAADCAAELGELEQSYRDRARKERERFVAATDSEYWVAVCFTSRKHKEAYLAALGADPDLVGDKYIDGHKLARLQGVELPD